MVDDPTRPDAAVDAEVDARLADILSPTFSEEERAQVHELGLQQLGFFRKELRRMVAFVSDTPDLGRTPGVRDVLVAVLDNVSDLHQELLARFQLPALDVQRSVEMPFDEVGIGTSIDDEDTGPSMSLETLSASLAGLQDGVLVIRESLLGSEAVADLLANGQDFMREMARGELLELATTLKELVDAVVETLAMLPPESTEAPALTPPPGPPRQEPTPATHVGILLPPDEVSVPRAPAAAILPARDPVSPNGATASGERVVKELQDFFNDHSPEGSLVRDAEAAFARMVGAALVRVCQGVSVTGADLTARIKILKDTFAMRKKLRNTLTLREFRSLFGATH
jgi:hypothetical protein